jgi:DNA-binding YbaB/EbfC family protein
MRRTTRVEEARVFKGLMGLGSLLKQAQEIGGRMQGLNEALRKRQATGSAGGGMVEVEVNGLMEVLSCRIDQSLVDQGDRELLEDLIATAINQAVAKSRELHAEAMKELTGGMDIPGLDEALNKMMGGSQPPEPSQGPGEE